MLAIYYIIYLKVILIWNRKSRMHTKKPSYSCKYYPLSYFLYKGCFQKISERTKKSLKMDKRYSFSGHLLASLTDLAVKTSLYICFMLKLKACPRQGR